MLVLCGNPYTKKHLDQMESTQSKKCNTTRVVLSPALLLPQPFWSPHRTVLRPVEPAQPPTEAKDGEN